MTLSHRAMVILLFAATSVGLHEGRNGLSVDKDSVDSLSVRDSLALENDYVRVWRNAAASPVANTPHFGTRVVVALSEVRVERGRDTLKLGRGGVAVVQRDESYSIRGGEFFEVAIKSDHPPVKGPQEWLEPVKNTVVYEDTQLRVFEERLAPGDTRELHSHAQRVVVRLNEVQLTDPRYYPDGTPGGGIQVPNTVRFAEPIVHVVRNLSAVPLFNIVIELKAPGPDGR